MARKKRKPREEISLQDEALLEPLDILKLGSEDDPCFGKLHDLTATECQNCGDVDFCAIVTAQNLHKERKKLAKEGKYKDLEEANYFKNKNEVRERRAKKFMNNKKAEGLSKTKVVIKASKKFKDIPRFRLKELYNQTN